MLLLMIVPLLWIMDPTSLVHPNTSCIVVCNHSGVSCLIVVEEAEAVDQNARCTPNVSVRMSAGSRQQVPCGSGQQWVSIQAAVLWVVCG